jgi:hypothetical protein
MERDRETVMEHYAGTVPEALDDLSPEERHKIYKMLRLEVLACPDKSLEVSGAILARAEGNERGELGALEPSRRSSSRPRRSKMADERTGRLGRCRQDQEVRQRAQPTIRNPLRQPQCHHNCVAVPSV